MTDSQEPAKRLSDRQIQTVCLMVLAGVAGVYLVYWLRPVLVPFIVACFIVSGVGPILTYLENRFNVSRVVAAGMAFLFGVLLMGVFGLTISFSIIDLATNSKQYRTRVRELVDKVEKNLSFDMPTLGKRSTAKTDPEIELPDFIESAATTPGDRVTTNAPSPGDVSPPPTTPAPDTAPNAATLGAAAQVSPVDTNDIPLDETAADTDSGDEPTTDSEADDSVSEASDQVELVSTPFVPSPIVEANPIQVRKHSQPVESSRMQEATELVDAFVRDGVTVVLQAFLSLVSTSIVVLIYVFFLLLGKPAFTQTSALREIDSQIRGYLSLKTVISIGTGALFGLTLRLFGVPMALSFGVLAFLLNFIPNIGPIVASLLPIPLILLDPSGNLFWMLSVIAATSTIQVISGNVIEPKLMGNSSDLHPVTILLGLMFWGMMWGIIGMFLATPITAAIKIVLGRFEPTRQIANIMAGRWEAPGQGVSPEVQANAQ